MRHIPRIIAVLLLLSTPALAQEPTESSKKKWAEGVSPEEQKIANDLFKEGNALVRDSNYNDGIAKYREAVSHWDHPAIHYNIVLALLNNGDALEIYASLQEAMKWGVEGLGEEKYEAAQTYLKLVEQQLVHIKLKCEQDGAKIVVDGKTVGKCPTESDQLLRAGEHTFAMSLEGYETTTVDKIYPGGQSEQIDLKIYRLDELTKYHRKFQPWLPWAVGGAGLAVVGIGGLLHASAGSDYKSFDAQIVDCGGCAPTQSQLDLRDGAGTKQVAAFVAYGVGTAAVVAGVTLMIMNRPQPYRVDMESSEGMAVVPTVSKDGVGVSASLHF
jgi:hypothetical protein